jgi:hypothetical protein
VGEDKGQYGLVGNHKGKRLLGRPTCRRENNVNMYFKEIGWERVDRMALVNTIMNVRASKNLGNFWITRETVGFLRFELIIE